MSTPQETPTALDRRSFCACALATGALACGGGGGGDSPPGGGGGGSTAGPKTTSDTKAGMLGTANGTVRDYRNLGAFWLIHDASGIYAMSSTCTHQGCTVGEGGTAFACPCHGSQFDLNGGNTQGPATVPLPHYSVSEPSPGANLVVDTSQVVASTVRLS